MADLTYDNVATERRPQAGTVAGKGDAHNVKTLITATIELATTASGQTIKFGRIPSNARLSGRGRVYWDDLATSGSPTLDMGLGSVGSNITSDPDALSNGHALSTADAEGVPIVGDIANIGLPAWDFVNGQASDPKGELEVYGTIKDATTNATGTVTVELYGYLD